MDLYHRGKLAPLKWRHNLCSLLFPDWAPASPVWALLVTCCQRETGRGADWTQGRHRVLSLIDAMQIPAIEIPRFLPLVMVIALRFSWWPVLRKPGAPCLCACLIYSFVPVLISFLPGFLFHVSFLTTHNTKASRLFWCMFTHSSVCALFFTVKADEESTCVLC